MKILRVFPRRTSFTPQDDLSFVGDPPSRLIRPEADEVHVSCTLTWDRAKAERLALAWGQYYPVKLGGCALGSETDGFTPGMYVRRGITFTSRGCNNRCPWCLVPEREGRLFELPIQEGNVLKDNNILQCSRGHLTNVFAMLRKQHQVELSGGLDSRLLTEEIASEIRALRLRQVFLAADTKEAIRPLRKAVALLQLPRNKVRCYVLLKFNKSETLSDARARMELVWEAGAMPFAQLYQPPDEWIDYPWEWTDFARTWSRPAAMKAAMKSMELV